MATHKYPSYQSYRGRMPGWKKWLVGILLLILVLAGAFLIFQPKLVVDASGGHWQNWLYREEEKTPSAAEPGSNADVEDGADAEDMDDFIIDIQEPAVKALHGRMLSAANPDFSALAEGERGVFTVKETNGTVVFGTAQDAAAAALQEQIAGRDAVAEISCFADSKKALSDWHLAVLSVSGKSWRDPNNKAWLDPYNENVTAYLTGIVNDCVSLGFTEIVLKDVQFPTDGRVDRVKYYNGQADTAESRAAAIEAFLRKAKETAGEDVKVSIVLPASLLNTGAEETAGWNLSAIAQIVDRIYMDAETQEEADQLRAAVGALRTDVDAAAFFVAQVPQAITGGSYVVG